jgi:uncharacterized protein
MLDNILKNMNLFVDGRGMAGNIEEITLPKLTTKTEEFRNGGMDAPVEIEMGMEKLEMDATLTRFDKEILKMYGLAPGNMKPLTIRGSLSSEDGNEIPVIINTRGMIKEVDAGSWKAGDKATLKISIALRYYKLIVNGEVIHEIDVPNMIRIIGGVDQLATQRANLGL